MPGFFQHGGVSISTFISWINEVCYIPIQWALYPCQFDNNRVAGGPALDSGSGDELQPGRYVIRTPPPREVFYVFVVHAADMNIPESGQAIVYFTTDLPRTRGYSINYTYTPHVRFPATVSSHLRSLTDRLGNEIRDASQRSRLPLLHYR